MRFDRTLPLRVLWVVYGAMWVGGVLRLRDGGWAAPLFLFVAGAIAVLSDLKRWRGLAGAAAIGFASELIGVKTGWPFGRYEYTGVLAPSIFGVPVAIACAWLVMFAFVRQFTRNIWIAAALLTATDLLIDPIASGPLGFWRWLTPGPYFGVPLVNFAGWYGVGLVLFAVDREHIDKSWSISILGASILLFFAVRM